jgi:hypothetical protein
MELVLLLNIKQQIIDNIDLMQCSRINLKKKKSSKKISFLDVTKAALVS